MPIRFIETISKDGESRGLFVAEEECRFCEEREVCLAKYNTAYIPELISAVEYEDEDLYLSLLAEMKSGDGICLMEI